MQPEGYRLIPLVKRRGGIAAFTKVDIADYEWLSQHRWHVGKGGYAKRTLPGNRTFDYMHRMLLGLEPGNPLLADHINRDRLDNRRANLRIVTAAQNLQNSKRTDGGSRFRGVSWHKQKNKWRATVKYDGKQHHVGLFTDELDAAFAAEAVRLANMPFAMPDPALEEVRRDA